MLARLMSTTTGLHSITAMTAADLMWTAGWEPYLPPHRGLQGRPLPPGDPN